MFQCSLYRLCLHVTGVGGGTGSQAVREARDTTGPGQCCNYVVHVLKCLVVGATSAAMTIINTDRFIFRIIAIRLIEFPIHLKRAQID